LRNMHAYPYRTCAEVDLNKLQRNLGRLRKIIGPSCKIMEVLKADAYGHGLRLCSRYAAPLVDWFAAATLEEALTIREEAPETPVLILGALLDEELLQAAENRLTIDLFSAAYARHVQQLMADRGLQIDGHIKIDTGMNRLGLRARAGNVDEAVEAAAELFSLSNIRVTGIYTHFACADTEDADDCAFSDGQFQAFTAVCEALTARGLDIGVRHCASTGGLLCHPNYQLDMVRTGMLPLGQSISEESAAELGLEPILTWYARVIDIREIPAEESVSYGRTYTFPQNGRVAVLSVGYADGYSRALTNQTDVILHGKKVPLRGKICMDFMMADITDLPDVRIGDQAVILGREGEAWISADYLAAKIPYDTNGGITAEINGRVRRVYRYNDAVVAVAQMRY